MSAASPFTSPSAQAWEGFWRAAPTGAGEVFWDADPALAVQLHLPLFEGHFDPGLPVVDLGCGNGTQTRHLAGRYARVVGIDLADAAIGRARAEDVHGTADFRCLDATDPDAMRALHAELGDAHLYLRGVLHQCAPGDRARIVANIAVLLGTRGRVFAVEPAASAKDVLRSLAQSPTGPPAKLRAVLSHGISPGDMADTAVPGLLAAQGLRVVASGRLPLATTEYRPDGSRIEIPTNWLVAAAAGGSAGPVRRPGPGAGRLPSR
ncbi:class I SAM-dependent methyltransferase [Streptomyces celluloflavus]|uniref:class I SAM-dependent methyltransferase n=1 Tax=Streptomyces celluloflavus TaxID=58344 RepID=UPI003646E31A